MIINSEIEYKIMLTNSEYSFILDECKKKFKYKEFIQSNYYFDTKDFLLKRNRVTLRLRNSCEKYRITIKDKRESEEGANIRKSKECTQNIEGKTAAEIISNRKNIFEVLDFNEFLSIVKLPCLKSDIACKGILETTRTEFEYYQESSLYLDRNCYLDKKDWELELEVDLKENIEFLINTIAKMNINMNKTVEGKYSRFVKEYIKKHI